MFATPRLKQRVPGVADHAIGGTKTLDPRVDGAPRLEVEDAGRLELVLADQPFDAVENPGYVAHAADHARPRE